MAVWLAAKDGQQGYKSGTSRWIREEKLLQKKKNIYIFTCWETSCLRSHPLYLAPTSTTYIIKISFTNPLLHHSAHFQKRNVRRIGAMWCLITRHHIIYLFFLNSWNKIYAFLCNAASCTTCRVHATAHVWWELLIHSSMDMWEQAIRRPATAWFRKPL